MRTLGIDLASQPRKTAACRIDWADGAVAVLEITVGVSDADALAITDGCDAVGIDAPFGWPEPFVAFLSGAEPPGAPPIWDAERRTRLSFRQTDLRVWERLRRPPLSVATDKIALPALRCHGLLAALGVTDRSGDGQVFEVYPAAALNAWGLASSGYKAARPGSRRDRPELATLLAALLAACPWLALPAEAASLCAADDDAFDALVCSLVARAAALGLTARPTPAEADLARAEGWIAVPDPGSLDRLADPA